MKNRLSICGNVLLLTLFFVNGHAQEVTKSIDLAQPLAEPLALTNAPLGSFIGDLSAKTHVAICIEDLRSENHDSFDEVLITFSSAKGDSIRDILDKLQLLYPQITWRVHDGVIILRAAALNSMGDDPLQAKAMGGTISGTFDAVKCFLAAGIPDFNPAIIERKGAINGQRTYDLRINPEMTVRDVLVMLTKKYGLRWHAGIRPERSNRENAPARVVLSFSDGEIPSEVRN